MKKRADASKRAMAELLSNSTDNNDQVLKPSSNTEGNREKLKMELMGSVGFSPSAQRESKAVQEKQTPSPMVRPEVQKTETVKHPTAQQNVQAQPRTVQQNVQAQPRTAPVVNTVQVKAAAPLINMAQIKTATSAKADTAQVKVVPAKRERAKKRAEKPKKKGLVAVISAIALILSAVIVTGVYLYINREEDFIPADVTAGVLSSEISAEGAVTSESAVQYLTDNRYSVKFTFYESPEIICTTTETTVGALMEKLGITVGEDNRCSMTSEDVLVTDSIVDIQTITYDTVSTQEAVPYETEYIDVRTIPKGTTKLNKEGKKGVRTYTYKLTLVNGVEESRELVSEAVTTKPVTRIMYRGVGGTVTSQGKTYNYSYYIDVKATVYNIVGNTASGLPTSTSVMAVDPKVIPLGTKCVVTGGSGDYGYRIAADTGGSIKGNKIDLWYPAGTFSGFGWRSTRVYILE